MQERLSQILEDAKRQLNEVSSMQDAEDIRIKVLGEKGQLTEILRSMGGLAPEERRRAPRHGGQQGARRHRKSSG